jgi:hypothetical protein
MGVLLAFVVGYAIGARAGTESFDDVVDSLKAVRNSEEFQSLLKALRTHAGHALRELATVVDGSAVVDGPGPQPRSNQDLVDRVRKLTG